MGFQCQEDGGDTRCGCGRHSSQTFPLSEAQARSVCPRLFFQTFCQTLSVGPPLHEFSCYICCAESGGIAPASWLRGGQSLPERNRPQNSGLQGLQVSFPGVGRAPLNHWKVLEALGACPWKVGFWFLKDMSRDEWL